MDHLNTAPGEPHVIPRRTIHGRLVGVYSAGEPKDLTCVAATVLTLALGGVPGDRHFGFTRKSGAREPWYPRGTEIRSGREISIVSLEELAEAARRMDLPATEPMKAYPRPGIRRIFAGARQAGSGARGRGAAQGCGPESRCRR